MLTLHQLSLGYPQRALATELNAHFLPGQLIALMGRNGTGKSTLLRTIAGLQPPLRGEVFLADKALSQQSAQWRAQHIALVLTERIAAPALRVEEVVLLGRLPYRSRFAAPNAADHAAVSQALARCGVQDFAQRRLVTLSDGERQRVMMARALAQDTPLLLLDEPTAFLDYPSKGALFALLREIADEGKCVLCATHDVEIALHHATHVALLTPQHLRIDTPQNWERRSSFAEHFELPQH